MPPIEAMVAVVNGSSTGPAVLASPIWMCAPACAASIPPSRLGEGAAHRPEHRPCGRWDDDRPGTRRRDSRQP
jgi:hypothetical protein